MAIHVGVKHYWSGHKAMDCHGLRPRNDAFSWALQSRICFGGGLARLGVLLAQA